MIHVDAPRLQLILLDRDGVINFDSKDFIRSPSDWRPLPGAIEAIAALQQRFQVCVCTNQSGVGRGYFDLATLDSIHDRLNQAIVEAGGAELDIFFCPHLPDAGCSCRKPEPGLLYAAMRRHGAAANQTLYVGDSSKDLEAAARAGCRAALVLTGNGAHTQVQVMASRSASSERNPPPQIHEDLAAFVQDLSDVEIDHG